MLLPPAPHPFRSEGDRQGFPLAEASQKPEGTGPMAGVLRSQHGGEG